MVDLQSRFRSLDGARPPDLWPEVVQRAAEKRSQTSTMSLGAPRLLILLAAMLLLAAMAAGVLGSIIRNDREDPTDLTDQPPFAFAGSIARPCDGGLPDGVVLRVRGMLGTDFPDPIERTLYADGLVIDGVSAEWGGSFNSMAATWSARRLSSAGSERLIQSVVGSLPSCRSFPFDGYMTIEARDGDAIHVIGLGPDPFETRVPTAEESSALAALVDQLFDPDLGMPSSGWADPDWLPYQPDRWRFSLTFSPASERDAASAAGVVLPDGSTLRTFGGETALVDAFGAGCVVRSAQEGLAIGAALTRAVDETTAETPYLWRFADDEGVITVTAAGLLPHEPDCVTEDPGLVSSTPVPAARAPVDALPPLDDACDYLDPADVNDVVGNLAGEVEDHAGWRADWHMCWYPVETDALVLAATRHAIPSERAREQAERLFGSDGLVVEDVDGGQLFFNGCSSNDATCRSAVAISAEPHFIVVTWGDGDRDTLRLVADRILATLAHRD